MGGPLLHQGGGNGSLRVLLKTHPLPHFDHAQPRQVDGGRWGFDVRTKYAPSCRWVARPSAPFSVVKCKTMLDHLVIMWPAEESGFRNKYLLEENGSNMNYGKWFTEFLLTLKINFCPLFGLPPQILYCFVLHSFRCYWKKFKTHVFTI